MSESTGAPATTASPAILSAQAQPDSKGLVGDDAAVAVVSLYQRQQKIYARAVSGLFATWRWSLVWATQLFVLRSALAGVEQPAGGAVRLGQRRFYIGPLVLYPQTSSS